MKLSEWASVAEIVSGIAVLITLIILIVSVRENTGTIRTSSYADSVDSIMELERTIVSDPELSRIYYALISRSLDELDERTDLIRAVFIQTMQFRAYEKAYFMRQRQLLGDEEWERFEASLCNGYTLVQDDNTEFGVMYGDFDDLPLTQEFRQHSREVCN